MDGIHIREANIGDCEQILGLIQELAVFEKQPDALKIDADVLRKDGFGDEKRFWCLVAEDVKGTNPTLVGYALYYFVYSTWEGCNLYLEDLYVKPSYRGAGIGTKLWREVAKVGVAKGCHRLDWVCLNWNTSSMDYYKRNGAVDLTSDEGWHLFRFRKSQLEAFAKGE